jgi:threonine/homoserine/homoserine lactone efflux protein
MSDLLPPWPMLSAFFAASFVLAVTPGPGVFYIVTRSLLQGRRVGLASVAGVALGNLGNALGASIGLAALFAVSSLAFLVVKYAGALYLVVLGVRVLRTPAASDQEAKAAASSLARRDEGAGASASISVTGTRSPALRVFRDGFVVALLNPKTAIFFAAFLPQFMGVGSVPVLRSVALGSIFVAIAATTDTMYALTAGVVSPMLARASGAAAWGRYFTGGAFIGLGVFTALTGVRSGK